MYSALHGQRKALKWNKTGFNVAKEVTKSLPQWPSVSAPRICKSVRDAFARTLQTRLTVHVGLIICTNTVKTTWKATIVIFLSLVLHASDEQNDLKHYMINVPFSDAEYSMPATDKILLHDKRAHSDPSIRVKTYHGHSTTRPFITTGTITILTAERNNKQRQ
jgi:hypothetical protein